MRKQSVLLFLLFAFMPAALQARFQDNPYPTPTDLRIYVEGEPSVSRAIIEAMRRSNAPYDFKVEFVSRSVDRHDMRLIVTGGRGDTWCLDAKHPHSAWFFYVSIVALASDGKIVFTAARSGSTAKNAVDTAAREVIKNLYDYDRLLKEKRRPPDEVASGAQRSAPTPGGTESGKDSIQGLPTEPGIYYKDATGWVRLREGFAADVKTTGMGAALLTWGISGIRMAQVYRGARAPVQISERRPSFYVRSFMLSERDVQIVRLEKKKGHREVQIASISAFSPRSGYRGRDIREVTLTRLSGDVTRIMPASEIEPGEYVLSLSKSGFAEGVYEFGIAP